MNDLGRFDLTNTEKNIYRIILNDGPITFHELMNKCNLERDFLIDAIDVLDNKDLVKNSRKKINVDRTTYGVGTFFNYFYETLTNDETSIS